MSNGGNGMRRKRFQMTEEDKKRKCGKKTGEERTRIKIEENEKREKNSKKEKGSE